MRLIPQPVVNTARLEAQLASDARWLVALLRWIGGIFATVSALPWVRDCAIVRDALAATKAGAAQQLRLCISDLRYIATEQAFARMRIATERTREKLYPGRGGALRARKAPNGDPICPATSAARTAGARGKRETGDMIQSRNHESAALSD